MNEAALRLEQQYSETGPKLLAYFRRQPRLAGLADDLVQETFLRAWRQRARLDAAASPRAYLFGIARHVGLDALRGQQKNEPWFDDVSAEADPADGRLELLRHAIAALPEKHREALLLKLQQELSYAEIADVLGVPVGTIRSRLFYAVHQLQAVLNPPAENPGTHHEL